MRGTIQNLNISGYRCRLYLPPHYGMPGINYPVVYVNGNSADIEEIINFIELHFNKDCSTFILLSIEPKNWNRDFSPWPAPALTKNSEDFDGFAHKYLTILTSAIKPFIDSRYRTKTGPQDTALIGYSLGGLTALYSLYIFGTFGRIGSLSGSLWYDGWIEFIKSNSPINNASRIYLSLGKNEERSRNERMAKVGACTKQTFSILQNELISAKNVTFEWNSGGHFTQISERFIKALLFMMHL